MKELVVLKKQPEHEWLKEVNSQSLQQSLWNLDDSFQRFFKKLSKFPTFKSKRNCRQSFNVPQYLSIDVKRSIVKIPKFDGIKVKIHRWFPYQNVESGTISKTSSGRYFISMSVEDKNEPIKPTSGNVLGIDFGVKTFMTLSTGGKISQPSFMGSFESRLKKLQRRFSKSKIGSNNRHKLHLKISRIHERITNQRDDFLHKLTNNISKNQGYNFVGIEDLNIVGMMNLRSLSKKIGELSWNRTTSFLNYKLERENKQLIKIGRFDPSSKMCCKCGSINRNLKLSDRTWKCSSCGEIHDRDFNASTNIKHFTEVILRELGREPSEFKSVEKLTSDDLRKMIVESASSKRKKFEDTIRSHLEAGPSLVGR